MEKNTGEILNVNSVESDTLEAIKKQITWSGNGIVPKLVIIEGYAFGRQVGRFFDIGELGGIVKSYLYKNEIPYLIMSPLSLKKWITGSARGDKSQIIMRIFKKYKIEFDDNNKADAFVLARYGYSLNKISLGQFKLDDFTVYERECVLAFVKKIK